MRKTQTPRIGEEEEDAIGKQPQWGLICDSVNKCKPRVAPRHKFITLKASKTQHIQYNSFVRLIRVNHHCIAPVILQQANSLFSDTKCFILAFVLLIINNSLYFCGLCIFG